MAKAEAEGRGERGRTTWIMEEWHTYAWGQLAKRTFAEGLLDAALTSQLELIELNEIKEFHAEMKMLATKSETTSPMESWEHSFRLWSSPGIYGAKIYEPQQRRHLQPKLSREL